MKKSFIVTAIVVTAMLTGCSNESEERFVINENAPVNFVIDGPVTRTVTDATTGITSFEMDDQIAIFSNGLQSEMEGTVFTVGDEGVLTTNGEYSFSGAAGASFYAYYPTDATGNTTSAEFTVATDQRTADAFGKSDFMTATKTVNAATAEAISLAFTHRLTLVKVKLSGGITAGAVEINNVQPTTMWTYETDVVETSGAAGNIQMGEIQDTSEYWAVIPAQTVSTGTMLFTITATDGKVYTYTPTAGDIVFSEGKIKKFTLALSAEEQVLVSLNTEMDTPWGDVEDESGDLTEIPLIPEVTESTVVKELQGSRTELNPGEWGFLPSAPGFAATVIAQNGGFDISITAAATFNPYWSNRTLYYKGKETFNPAKTYTLKLKASSRDAGQLWINVTDRNEPIDIFYHLNAPALVANNIGSRILISTNTNEIELNIEINPKLTIETTSNAVDGFTETSYTDYCIGICANSNSLTTYTIRDITLVEN